MFPTEIVCQVSNQYHYEIVDQKFSTFPNEIVILLILQKETSKYAAFIVLYEEAEILEIIKRPPIELKIAQDIFDDYKLNQTNYGFD